jgi:hypothetical protein
VTSLSKTLQKSRLRDKEIIASLRGRLGPLDYTVTGNLGHVFYNGAYVTTLSLLDTLSTRPGTAR